MPFQTTSRSLRRAVPLLALAAACESDLTVTDIAVRLTVTPASDTLPLGATATPFRGIAVNLNGDTVSDDVRWAVGNPTIASVDSVTGALTGLAPGATPVIARTGSLTDTARLTVLGLVTLGLRLDTILLAPGDTFTVPHTALGPLGEPIAATFAGADPAVATIAPNGYIQAIGVGRTAFTLTADSATLRGIIDVVAVDDTLGGTVMATLSGAVQRQVRLPSRWFQYPAPGGGSVLNIAARDPDDRERILAVLRDGLTAPGTRTVGPFPEGDPTVAVCDPPNGWMLYQDLRAAPIEALSVAGAGTVLVQRVDPIPGGWRVSATVNVTLERTGGAPVTLFGRFVVPLLALPGCPG